ncbi:NAD(P)-dependent oxidoreductase [Chloroflexi bacterium TSY]|nr:NAD(P)-dependent oxidoreductase [Chloroflexi bacterium TSY]
MTTEAIDSKRVLVTGSTGAIGQPVCQHLLVRGHSVRGFARRPTPNVADHVIGDLSDRDAVFRAVEGMDTVIHLGAYPNPADFLDVLIGPNVIGLYNICEAAREFSVQRLVLASTLQVVTGHGWSKGQLVRIEDGPKPVNHYALTKAWAEVIGDMYARNHNISVLSVRIGWLPRNPSEAAQLVQNEFGPDVFFSHEDAKRFHERCVESPTPGPGESAILFATSKPLNAERLDLEPSRRIIGYEPQDTWPEGLPYAVDGG